MISSEVVKDLVVKADTKIVLVVMDGLGGLPHPGSRLTELESARTPNLDKLARRGMLGLIDPIAQGITPGSGPAHLALFGYDPFRYQIGRGAVAAFGIGFDMHRGDVAVRINFATIDENGNITDRRAGRIPTEKNAELCKILRKIKIEGVEVFIEPVKDHRGVVIFRGEGLYPELSDTDPQAVGVPPKRVEALDPRAERAAEIANEFIAKAREALKDQHPANMILMRGFESCPEVPSMEEVYGLRCAAIAVYPDYKGMARIVGMDVLEAGSTVAEEVATLEDSYDKYDFFFFHVKPTDSSGEDGNFEGKSKVIEEVDSYIPRIARLNPEVLIVTGDHSTPSLFKAHSWHPVPFMMVGKWVRPDDVKEFSETACARGSLGRFPATEVMALAMAHAERLVKFGA